MNLTEESLTNREQEVYKYLLQGLSYIDIANKLVVEKSTIITHIMHVYMKKMVGNRAELMAQRIKELEEKVKELKGAKRITRV